MSFFGQILENNFWTFNANFSDFMIFFVWQKIHSKKLNFCRKILHFCQNADFVSILLFFKDFFEKKNKIDKNHKIWKIDIFFKFCDFCQFCSFFLQILKIYLFFIFTQFLLFCRYFSSLFLLFFCQYNFFIFQHCFCRFLSILAKFYLKVFSIFWNFL